MNRLSRSLFAATLLVAPAWVLAQGARQIAPAKPRAVAPSGASTTRSGNVIIKNSPSGTAEYDDNLGVARLTKDVTVTQVGEGFILRAQTLTYSRPRNVALASGNLRIETRDSTLRGEQLSGDFNTKVFRLSGRVVISAHGKNDGVAPASRNLRADLESKPVRISCNRADWNYDTQQAVLGGNIRMVQEKTVGTCDRIQYDERQNIVRLEGNVRFVDKTGNTIEADEIVYYVDSGRIAIKGTPIIKFKNEEFSTPGRTTKTTPKPRETFAAPPRISNDVLKQFDLTPAPIPGPRARPTEAPEPTPIPDEIEGVETPEEPLVAPTPPSVETPERAGRRRN